MSGKTDKVVFKIENGYILNWVNNPLNDQFSIFCLSVCWFVYVQ